MLEWEKRATVGWALNAIDGLLTLLLIYLGLAHEANPFMAALMNISWLTFISFKMIIWKLFLWVGRIAETHLIARLGIVLVTVVYGATVLSEIYHLLVFFLNHNL